MKSIWMSCETPRRAFAALKGQIRVDVVVVGGGITGLITAMRLKQAGLNVAVLEAHRIGAGNTGLSTGNLYAPVSGGMADLDKRWGTDVLRQVTELRATAVTSIEEGVKKSKSDCDFRVCPLSCYVKAPSARDLAAWEHELRAYERAGLSPVECQSEMGFATEHGFRIAGQAQFNPYLFASALGQWLAESGVPIYEQTPVIDLNAKPGEVITAQGAVLADHLVLATHTPLGFNLLQAEMEVYREYGVALKVEAPAVPSGIHWVRDEGRSLRPYRTGESNWLVIVGEKHKTGEHEPGVDYTQRLVHYAVERFKATDAECRWSAQQFKSADGLPYIGPSAHRNVWLATGFGADGLTWGTVAAQLICEGIEGRASEAAKLFSPRRFTPIKSAKGWGKENATVLKHMVKDRVRKPQIKHFNDVPAGEGRIVDADGVRVAVYRSEEGEVYVMSPVCPHLGCHVKWNGQASSWDCPCHGSRFTARGEVIEGPALKGLAQLDETCPPV